MPGARPFTYDPMRRICPAQRQPRRNPVDGFPIETGQRFAFHVFRRDVRAERSPEPGRQVRPATASHPCRRNNNHQETSCR
jgi:hypothetical protein